MLLVHPDIDSDALFALFYNELHQLAEASLRRAGAALTLGATTLIHEAYLNIAGRQITLDDESPSAETIHTSGELERLGDALNDLAKLEPALADLVDMHFFAGFSFTEIAELRGVSDRTVQRDWRKARLLLHHALLES
jgi:DNA-directed RNA polymerase specialized sigma24 family protein